MNTYTRDSDLQTTMNMLDRAYIEYTMSSPDGMNFQILIRTSPNSYYAVTQGVLFTFDQDGNLTRLEDQRK